jgi:hypothetical protein
VVLILSVQLISAAAATNLTVQTNQPTYPVGLNTIIVSGNVTPPPNETNTWVAISILSPNGALVDANQFEVNPTTGAFNGAFVTGGPTYTGAGAYTVKAEYESINATAVFQYGNSTLSNQTITTNTTSSETISSTSTQTPTSTSTSSTQTSTTPTSTSTVSSNSTTSTSVETLSPTSHSTTSSSSSAALEIGPVTLLIIVALALSAFAIIVRVRRPSIG